MFCKCQLESECKYVGGFSLIEVLITAAIIGIVTAIIVIKYGSFNSSVLLRNHAYEIALTIRQAQVFSVSTRGESSSFRDGYGIFVDMTGGGPAQSLILYRDENITNPSKYDAGTDPIIETLVLDSRFEIIDICVTVGAATVNCASDPQITDLSMTFRRPIFDPQFNATNASVGTISTATITIAPVGDTSITRNIIVGSSGQISVQ